MGPLIEIGVAVAALGLTAVLVLVDVRPPSRPKPERAPRRPKAVREPRRAKQPRIKPPPRRARARAARKADAEQRQAAIVDFARALREPEAEPEQAQPVAMGSVGATALEPQPLGRPVLRPDPERLIQHEVVEPDGPVARLSAFFRLLTWVGMAGLLLAFGILALIRTIVLMFEGGLF